MWLLLLLIVIGCYDLINNLLFEPLFIKLPPFVESGIESFRCVDLVDGPQVIDPHGSEKGAENERISIAKSKVSEPGIILSNN